MRVRLNDVPGTVRGGDEAEEGLALGVLFWEGEVEDLGGEVGLIKETRGSHRERDWLSAGGGQCLCSSGSQSGVPRQEHHLETSYKMKILAPPMQH